MLGIAECPIAHQHDRLRHVGVEVVARFRNYRVKRPRQRIDHGEVGHGAVAASGVGQRFDQTVGGNERCLTKLGEGLGKAARIPRRPRALAGGRCRTEALAGLAAHGSRP